MGSISQTIDAIINERKKRLIIIEDAIKKVETSESAVNAFKEAQHKLNFETLGISKGDRRSNWEYIIFRL